MHETFQFTKRRTVKPSSHPHSGRVSDPRVADALEKRDLESVRVSGAIGTPLGETVATNHPSTELRLGSIGHEILELCSVSRALAKADLPVAPALWHVLETVLELVDAVHYGHGTGVAAELETDVHLASESD